MALHTCSPSRSQRWPEAIGEFAALEKTGIAILTQVMLLIKLVPVVQLAVKRGMETRSQLFKERKCLG